jgi:hypothetical protein
MMATPFDIKIVRLTEQEKDYAENLAKKIVAEFEHEETENSRDFHHGENSLYRQTLGKVAEVAYAKYKDYAFPVQIKGNDGGTDFKEDGSDVKATYAFNPRLFIPENNWKHYFSGESPKNPPRQFVLATVAKDNLSVIFHGWITFYDFKEKKTWWKEDGWKYGSWGVRVQDLEAMDSL